MTTARIIPVARNYGTMPIDELRKRPPGETLAAGRWRLAALARALNLRVRRHPDPETGELLWLVSSSTHEGLWHRVNPDSLTRGCDCRGYQGWRRCTHHSAVLAATGQLPDPWDDEAQPAVVPEMLEREGYARWEAEVLEREALVR